MPWDDYLLSLAGGLLIGAAASMLLLLNGRIAGISGIAGGLVDGLIAPVRRLPLAGSWQGVAFIGGLLLGPLLYGLVFGHLPAASITQNVPLLIAGGLLVGFGTRRAGGCASGHGVCGMARLSRRSMAAVATFFAVAMATVFVMEHAL